MERLAEFFKVLSEPNRLTVLESLKESTLNVTAIVENTGLSQALVSKHLKLLSTAGFVERMPDGGLVFYKIADKKIFKLITQAEKLIVTINQQRVDSLTSHT